MLFKSETTLNNNFDKDFGGIIFADRRKIQTLSTRFFRGFAKNTKSTKTNSPQIKLAKFNFCEN